MDFYELQKNSLLLESIANAKSLLVKDYAEKQKKAPNEIPEEIKKSIWRDPKFQKVINLLGQKNQGWAYAFTKFYVIDGAPWEDIESVDSEGNPTGIYNMLIQLRPGQNDLELKNIDAYARLVPSEEDHRPSYEVLGDELRSLQSKRKLKKIYDELIPRMKKEFDKAAASKDPKDKELIQNLELFALSLEKLEPRKNEETGEMEYPFKEFKRKTGMRFSDTEAALHPEYGNPSFKDPKVAFRALVRECQDLVDNWNAGLDEYTEKILKLGLRAGIFYNKNKYFAMSARTPEAQRAVSGDTNFCINNDSTFWSYGDGSIQLNIINGNLPKANKKYLLGVTIKKDGIVKNCAWKTNSGPDRDFHRSGINYAAFLKDLEYPAPMIQAIIDKFDEEVTIKLSLEKFYRESKSLTPNSLIKSLIDIKQGIFNGVVSPDQWDQVSGIVSFIVKEERNIPTSDFVKEFKDGGIFTVSAWEVFDYVVEGDYTKKDIEKIKETTISVIETLEEFIILKEKGKTFNIPEDQYKKMVSAVKYKDENIAKLDALIAAK
jgi:hypothetical protein